jgi:hypothetical protein
VFPVSQADAPAPKKSADKSASNAVLRILNVAPDDRLSDVDIGVTVPLASSDIDCRSQCRLRRSSAAIG